MQSTWRDRDRDFRKRLPGGETTENRLREVLHKTNTESTQIPGFDLNPDSKAYLEVLKTIDCDEVFPGIYIGDGATAKNIEYLKKLGVTHVLNAAEGRRFGFVNTNKTYYKGTNMKYLGLPLADSCVTDISKYFYTVATFIDDALSLRGKAFVHCLVGTSRSATCVLAYLMIKKNMLAVDAIRIVRKHRKIQPNGGFLYQLAQLDNRLRRQQL